MILSSQPLVMDESANKLRYTIIDEADELVSADWSEDLKMIFSGGGTYQIGHVE